MPDSVSDVREMYRVTKLIIGVSDAPFVGIKKPRNIENRSMV